MENDQHRLKSQESASFEGGPVAQGGVYFREKVETSLTSIFPITPQEAAAETSFKLQIEMDAKQHAAMIELMEVCGFATKREMINNYLTLASWVKDKLLEGREINAYHPVDKSVVELRMRFFSNIDKSKKVDQNNR